MRRAKASIRGILVKSSFKSKLPLTRLQLNYSPSLVKKNESFKVYTLRVIGLNDLLQNFPIVSIGVLIAKKDWNSTL